jgi:hypothetical protein
MLPGILEGNGGGAATKKKQPVPLARFNHPVSADRVVGHVRMEMKPLKRLKKKFNCTINDIALCVISGALREYLLQQDELPSEDLQTLMPVNIRHKKESGSLGNHVTVAKLSLYTGMKKPGERLKAIHADSFGQKRRIKKGGTPAMNLVDDIHPAIILFLGKWLVSSGHIDDLPPTVNTAVTNVPGIPHDAYLDGVKLIDYLGFGPLAPKMGLFHTVSSTEDHVNISFLSTSVFLDNGEDYQQALAQSWGVVSRL